MKKTFITPRAEVKAMASSEMICASTLGVSDQQVGGSEGSPIQAGAKVSRITTWSMGKMDF